MWYNYTMKNCLFLDFDGVLFDTLKEAYLLCRFAFIGIDFFEPIDENEYRRFYRYKFLVFNSWQYYYLMYLLQKNLSDNELISKFSLCLIDRKLSAEEEFDKKYYSARKELMQNHHEFWDSLEKPFPFFDGIKQYSDDVVIVSKKNKEAINYRLKQHGLILPTDRIFGKDELITYRTKADFISEYILQKNIENALFVDDNSNNLRPAASIPNLTCLLAGWGNIAIGEKGYSEEEILDIIRKNYI